MNVKNSNDLHYLWWLTLTAALGALIYLLSPILTPFLLAGLIAYICNPLVTKIAAWNISRALSTILVIMILLGASIAIILTIIPLFDKEISQLIKLTPAYLEAIKNNLIPWLETRMGFSLPIDIALFKQELLERWKDVGGITIKFLPSLTDGSIVIIEFLMNLFLVPVVLFYLLRDWNKLVRSINEIIPPRWTEQINMLAYETDCVLTEFLRGQLAVVLLMSIYYVTGLWLVGLEFALPIGILTGILVFVPYFGTGVGLILATLVALMQFQGWDGLIQIWIVFLIGQLLENIAITPWLIGNRIGLHPVLVIFALLAFGQLFGFLGVLLALPVSAALLVWLRHARKQYLKSNLYGP